MELDLYELQYLLSRFPDKSDDERVCLLRRKIERWIEEELKQSDESLNWFKDPLNQHTALKEFLEIPYNIRSMSIRELFPIYEKPIYIRLRNILTRRGFGVVEDLLELTVYQFKCLRGVGVSGQIAILQTLLGHTTQADPHDMERGENLHG
ncbi:hypothetical protein SAMN05661091_2953 [Paenibacillus uliginis N3/975]|uniref:RNA polymerase, alpha chain C terminal domain n=1 Tax=Paenibacillus uliginis N3/975 TaxID=1313296 RepID=A0A1X7HG76_9BACL|nr:hypothetical protein [Paenibacillus uliginis]SMF85299.1 hypothetical protein SAMN05661091_2953 [Paenibacillus uliginis N3/975]